MTIDYDSNTELKRHAIGTAYCFWKNYTNLMDEFYSAVDLQRNLSFVSSHDQEEDDLQD